LNSSQDEENSCKEILHLEDLYEHFNKCKFSKRYAKCMGCNKEGLYEEIINHTYYCNEIIVKCNFCNEKIKKKFYEVHKKKCQENTIKCPVCSIDCKLKNFEYHKNKGECQINKKIDDIKTEYDSKIYI